MTCGTLLVQPHRYGVTKPFDQPGKPTYGPENLGDCSGFIVDLAGNQAGQEKFG